MRTLPFLVLLLPACASSSRQPAPLGVEGNLTEASRHDAEAARHDRMAHDVGVEGQSQPVCGDTAIADQTTSGGERVGLHTPCWTSFGSTAEQHREQAARQRDDARVHRAKARKLVEAERRACATMPTGELNHTPFSHRDDIATVVAELDGDKVRGARIELRPVAGLTADWLRTAIGCHQARAAALGYDPTYMGYDPTLLAGVDTEVLDSDGHLVVVVRASDEATALAVYGRAEELTGAGW
jgi:hypothetical protein